MSHLKTVSLPCEKQGRAKVWARESPETVNRLLRGGESGSGGIIVNIQLI